MGHKMPSPMGAGGRRTWFAATFAALSLTLSAATRELATDQGHDAKQSRFQVHDLVVTSIRR